MCSKWQEWPATCVLQPGALYGGNDNPFMRTLVSGQYIYPGNGNFAHGMVPKKLCAEGEDSVAAGKVYILCSDDKMQQRELLEPRLATNLLYILHTQARPMMLKHLFNIDKMGHVPILYEMGLDEI